MALDNTALIPMTWTDPYNTECPCCLEIPQQGRIILECKHLICIPCFVTHIQRSRECPICRVEMFKLPRPHTVARNTQTGRRQTRNSMRIFEQEVNRRLSEHINEVNDIRAYVNRNRIINNGNLRRTLRDAPPLRAGRTGPDHDQDHDHAPAHGHDHANNTNNIYETIQTDPISSHHYIMVTLFTAADIFVMLLWLYVINNKK